MKSKHLKLTFSEIRPFFVALLVKRAREREKEQNQKRADAAGAAKGPSQPFPG